MTQRALYEVRDVVENPEVFKTVSGRSDKIRCKVCLATGYARREWRYGPDEDFVMTRFPWWGTSHERGHPWDCSYCERAFSTPQGLANHRRQKHPTI